MPNLSAVNPNLVLPSGEGREYTMVDYLLLLRDVNDGAETATANETPIAIAAEKLGDCAIVVNHRGTAGTVDGSNYFTLRLEAADNSGFSNPTTIWSKVFPAAADTYRIDVSGAMLESIRTTGEDASIYIRSGVTKTGTTATSVTYGAYLTSNV